MTIRKAGWLFLIMAVLSTTTMAQSTFPVNGVGDTRNNTYAFTDATIVQNGKNTLQNATLVIKDGRILSVGSKITVPAEAIVIDCKGKFIYPSFIDMHTDYGMPNTPRTTGGFNFN